MTDQELEQKLTGLVRSERKITREIVETIAPAEMRKIYMRREHSTLFTWLTNYYGYSRGAANRRKDAAYALPRAPFIGEKLANGSLNFSNVSMAHSMIYKHEQKTKKWSAKDYESTMRKLENKTTEETQKILAEIFPQEAKRESKRPISKNEIRLFVTMSAQGMSDLEWLKAHWSHTFPEGKFADIIARAAEEVRAQLEKQTSQPKPDHQTTGQKARKIAIARAQGKCQYVDPETGNLCGSTYQVQVDHIVPRALGGLDNLAV